MVIRLTAKAAKIAANEYLMTIDPLLMRRHLRRTGCRRRTKSCDAESFRDATRAAAFVAGEPIPLEGGTRRRAITVIAKEHRGVFVIMGKVPSNRSFP
jgi:hypothetical protein